MVTCVSMEKRNAVVKESTFFTQSTSLTVTIIYHTIAKKSQVTRKLRANNNVKYLNGEVRDLYFIFYFSFAFLGLSSERRKVTHVK